MVMATTAGLSSATTETSEGNEPSVCNIGGGEDNGIVELLNSVHPLMAKATKSITVMVEVALILINRCISFLYERALPTGFCVNLFVS